MLKALSVLWHLFRSLDVPGLPVEVEKLRYIVEYVMAEGPAKEKLLQLVGEGFEVLELYSYDGFDLYDQTGRSF